MSKQSKSDPDIQYQYHPNVAKDERCGDCVMFISPDKCTDVSGEIVRQGWCKIFARRP